MKDQTSSYSVATSTQILPRSGDYISLNQDGTYLSKELMQACNSAVNSNILVQSEAHILVSVDSNVN